MVYQWSEGSRIKIKAQVAGERIETLRERFGGEVTPEIIVDDARAENSPLHPAFEWDDDKAAESFRRQQANQILCAIVVKIDEKPDLEPVRAFVNVNNQQSESIFTSISDAMKHPAMREQVIRRAKAELAGWRRRYAAYQELATVFEVIDEVVMGQ